MMRMSSSSAAARIRSGVATAALCLLVLLAVGPASTTGFHPATVAQPWNPNITEIIQELGYPCDQYSVPTADGFVLSVQRIPRPGAPVVFLQHGILDSANTWAMNFASDSLSIIMYNAGFDVWLGNSRGNGYSMTDIYYNADQDGFWNWSWDQMADYDLPACFDFILQNTGQTKLGYVGHSQGTTIAFAHFAKNSAEAFSKVHTYVALAPVAHIGHVDSIMLKGLARVPDSWVYDVVGEQSFLPTNTLVDKLLPGVCKLFPDECVYPACLMVGCEHNDVNASRSDFYFSHYPAPCSTQDLVHWGQMVKSGNFCAYDYGSPQANEQHYGTEVPPAYDLGNITIPTFLFSGGNDALADPTDVQILVNSLNPTTLKQHVVLPQYGHLDFVWGEHANVQLYPQVVKIIQAGANQRT